MRRVPGGGDRFELIAGERRWRALQQAGLREALVVVKDVSAKDAFELALIENVQREDLNPIELAEAFDRLRARARLHAGGAWPSAWARTARPSPTRLRLLKLPPRVRAKVVRAS